MLFILTLVIKIYLYSILLQELLLTIRCVYFQTFPYTYEISVDIILSCFYQKNGIVLVLYLKLHYFHILNVFSCLFIEIIIFIIIMPRIASSYGRHTVCQILY